MATIVKGHGARVNDVETFVPVGTTLKFYSDFDVNLSNTVALLALATGADRTPNETIVGTGKVGDVDNYELGQQDDFFIAQWTAISGKCSLPIKWVGKDLDLPDGIKLCNAPDTCTGGVHSCTGVLGKVKDTDIIVVACRGYVPDDPDEDAPDSGSEYKYGKDKNDPLRKLDADTDEFVDQILELALKDPAAAEVEVDSLPQGSIAFMVSRMDFDSWQKARHLKDRAQAGDFEQMIGHLKANQEDLDRIMEWLDDIPSYGTAVDKAVIGKMATFADEYEKAPSDAVLEALGTRKAIVIAAKALKSDWQPDDKALTAVETKNAANVKNLPDKGSGDILAGGLLVLFGDGHDDDAVGYVQRQDDFEKGSFQVGKAGAFGAGSSRSPTFPARRPW
jgi:hypothetical protein